MSFDEFMSQLSESNATLDFFVDFEKSLNNVNKISIHLNQLNYLLGQEDLERAIRSLYQENRKCFSVLNILIAVRDDKKAKVIDKRGIAKSIESYFNNVDEIIQFIYETGLASVFSQKNIKNLVDYVFGVEVGLDTNARKNRSGKNMEKLIATIFRENNLIFEEQVSIANFEDLTALGQDIKNFDFVIRARTKVYLIEVNYYNGGGSKLNETARAYTDLASKINSSGNYEFVWITDGQGWKSARNKLEEAYNNIQKVYNLASLYKFVRLITSDLAV